MAIASLSPLPAADEVSLTAASALFAETGHPIAVKVLKRLCLRHGTSVWRVGRDDCASWTDLLKLHAAWVDAREARG
ncbi:hypothetical protein [Streptomyces sp. NPDC093269]|uniref:hypothetical protein n=1 Tax=Streptomyces sp. NPDC093269 TaxID=3366038 RepID=UPI0038232523